MKEPVEKREQVVLAFLSGEITKKQAGQLLGCRTRTIERYRNAYRRNRKTGLIDHRHSNYQEFTETDRTQIITWKTRARWRSARNIRDMLGLAVPARTVWEGYTQAGLGRENIARAKPSRRVEAEPPNDLWQCAIMGRIDFPKVGTLYLIAALDDHSRFCLSGKWFRAQGKMNVFQIWYEVLAHYNYRFTEDSVNGEVFWKTKLRV